MTVLKEFSVMFPHWTLFLSSLRNSLLSFKNQMTQMDRYKPITVIEENNSHIGNPRSVATHAKNDNI